MFGDIFSWERMAQRLLEFHDVFGSAEKKTQLLSKMLQITTPVKHWLRFAAFHVFSCFIAASMRFSNEWLNH